MLSPEERQQIREEMLLREEIRRELAPPAPGWLARVMGVLNGPFVVTLIGAALLAYLGHVWQANAARREVERARWQALQDRKYELLGSFCQDLESATMVLGSLHEAKLREQALKSGPQTRVTQKQMAQLKQLQRDLWTEYQSCRKPNAGFVQVRALFDGREVMSKVDALDQAETKMQKSTTVAELYRCKEGVDKAFSDLAAAMGTELKNAPVAGHTW